MGSTRCLREDVSNPDLLYLGTEFAVFVSLDRGASWTKLNNNLPTVAVHEIAVHPEAGEIVVATHGRSLWILDVAALRQITSAALKDKVHLYKPHTAVRWPREAGRGGTNRRFAGENPPFGASIYYSLAKKADKINLRVLDIDGTVVRELTAPSAPGLHKVAWDTRRAGRSTPRGPGRPGQGGRGGRFQQFGPAMPAGSYRVVLSVDGQEFAQSFRVEGEASDVPRLFADDDDDDK
jgi:FlgD Ig-like domain